MSKMFRLLLIGLLATGLVNCSASADPNDESGGGLLSAFKPAPKITVPAGTRLRVALIDGVSSENSSPGDEFMASLAEPVVVDGKTVIEAGTKVHGRVVDAEESGRVKGRASLNLILTALDRNGKTIDLETKTFAVEAEAQKGRDAAIIGGGAGIGAAVGAIAGGKKGAGIGALIGGGAGTGTVLATKGNDIHYPPETKLNFTLASSLQI